MACVRDLMSLESFQDITLVAGYKGLYRRVSWPNIAQTPDIREWLVGGDVILMTGIGLDCTYTFLNSILNQAAEGNAGCLVILLSPERIPRVFPETLAYAEKLNFPVFTAHWEIRIANIIRDISSFLLMERHQEEAVNSLLEELLFLDGNMPSDALQAFIKKHRLAGNHAVVLAEYAEICPEALSSLGGAVSRQQSADMLVQELKAKFPKTMYLNRYKSTFFLIPIEPEQAGSLVQLASRLCCDIDSWYPGLEVHFAIGRIYSEPLQFYRSLQEAKKASAMCRESRKVICFSELGIYQLLMDVPNQEQIIRFTEYRLRPLLEYEQKNNKNLLPTLEMYLQTNCNAVQTAQKLQIHRNSLAYRLTRIQELLGTSLEDAEDRNELYNCLKIYRYCQK